MILCEEYEGNMNGKRFSDFIHKQFPEAFKRSANPEGKLFLQDGDPSQNSKKATVAMNSIGVKKFTIPARMTEGNPIENVFNNVKRKVHDDAIEHNIMPPESSWLSSVTPMPPTSSWTETNTPMPSSCSWFSDSEVYVQASSDAATQQQQDYEDSNELGPQLGPRRQRRVYMLTYSNADPDIFCSAQSFREGTVSSFKGRNFRVMYWVAAKEKHLKTSGFHFHMALNL